jgi:hypothetical protein
MTAVVDDRALRLAETHRAQTRAEADATAAEVVAAFDALGARFVAIGARTIGVANARATVQGVRYVVTSAVLVHGQVDPTTLHIGPMNDLDRLARACRTAAEIGRASVERLARSEPLQAGQRAVSAAMRSARMGWTRLAGAGACPICTALADGTVLSASTPMVVPHPSCSCSQLPTEVPRR